MSHGIDSGARSDVLDCMRDYVGIPDAGDGSIEADRYCGTFLNPYSTGIPGIDAKNATPHSQPK